MNTTVDSIAASLLAERFAYRGEPYVRTPPTEDDDAACAQRCRDLLAEVERFEGRDGRRAA